jgi:hypothetical protein
VGELTSKLPSLQYLMLTIRIPPSDPSANEPMDWPNIDTPVEVLTPLRNSTSLTELCSHGITERNVDAIRAIPSLVQLRKWCESSATKFHLFEQLVADPTPRWEACGFIPKIVVSMALPSLFKLAPTLNELHTGFADVDLQPILSRFERLTDLRLHCFPPNDISSIVNALQRMTKLEKLWIENLPTEVTSQHLSDILPPLASLTELEVSESPLLKSLAFLHACSPHIRRFCLNHCRGIRPIELHLASATSRWLQLYE